MVVFETEHHAALLRSLHRETADQRVIYLARANFTVGRHGSR